MIYLDAAATAPVRREVLEAMWPALTQDFGNPSSHHTVGEAALRALDYARGKAAEVLGCRPGEIIFTSGGTESNNLAIKGIALAAPRGRHIVTSAVEHPSVLEAVDYLVRFHGFEATRLPVDAAGTVRVDALEAALREDTTLCTVMYANNEVGTIQPIARIGALCRAAGVPFHTDAVQAAGWLDLDVVGAGRGRAERVRPQAGRAQGLRRCSTLPAGFRWSRCCTAGDRNAAGGPAPRTLPARSPWPRRCRWRTATGRPTCSGSPATATT